MANKAVKFFDMNIKAQADVFGHMADNVQRKFPGDIKKQANALGKAFDKVTGKKR